MNHQFMVDILSILMPYISIVYGVDAYIRKNKMKTGIFFGILGLILAVVVLCSQDTKKKISNIGVWETIVKVEDIAGEALSRLTT